MAADDWRRAASDLGLDEEGARGGLVGTIGSFEIAAWQVEKRTKGDIWFQKKLRVSLPRDQFAGHTLIAKPWSGLDAVLPLSWVHRIRRRDLVTTGDAAFDRTIGAWYLADPSRPHAPDWPIDFLSQERRRALLELHDRIRTFGLNTGQLRDDRVPDCQGCDLTHSFDERMPSDRLVRHLRAMVTCAEALSDEAQQPR